MVKVVMREPIISGFTKEGVPYNRGLRYMLCGGELTESFKAEFEKAVKENGVISMVEANGSPVFIPARNIAWMQIAVATDENR